MKTILRAVACCALSWILSAPAPALDWPTWNQDVSRSGVTSETLTPPLEIAWTHQSPHPPEPAWPASPAKQDYWHGHDNLRPTVTYDRAYHATVVDDSVYYGSSADDKVYCLNVEDGRERWHFFTSGPVRLAPTVWERRVYVGSDDGAAYCLDAKDGKVVWKHEPHQDPYRLLGNDRFISIGAIRTGVLVDGGKAFCFGGFFPLQGVYGCALDARDGTVIWEKQMADLSPQGYLLASPRRLFVPTGRTTPAVVDRETGEVLGMVGGQGGAYAILMEPGVIASGPGRASGALDVADAETRETIASFPGGLHMLVREGVAWLHSHTELTRFDRARYMILVRERSTLGRRASELQKTLKEPGEVAEDRRRELEAEQVSLGARLAAIEEELQACFAWRLDCEAPFALILAGDTLFAGGQDRVLGIDAASGEIVWQCGVPGRAYGLAAAQGHLFVSTDSGAITAFRAETYEGVEGSGSALEGGPDQ